MRNTFGKLCVIAATLLLLFSAAFFTVSLILRDSDLIGNLYKKPEIRRQVEAATGIERQAEMENATIVLLEYMRGERTNIKVGATVNGAQQDDLFSIEKEVVHMAEVQTLWLGLEAFSKLALPVAVVLLIAGFLLIERGKKRAILSSGIFWGCGILGGILAFLGVWAVLDFSSFWTVFHFMIFPTIVLRCGISVISEIAVLAITAVFIRFAWRKQDMPSPVADVVVIEHDENEPVPIKGPDLVLAHTLSNVPVSKREEILRRVKNGEPAAEKQSTPVREHLLDPIYPKTEETTANTQSADADNSADKENSTAEDTSEAPEETV